MSAGFTQDELGLIVRTALPFITQWLMSGDPAFAQQRVYRAPSDDLAPDLERVRHILRLRLLLAEADRLLSLLTAIQRYASTHRTLEREEVVGQIRGRLDVPAYLARRHRRTVPRPYPCIVVERDVDTPENVLLCLTLLRLRHEMLTLAQTLRPLGAKSAVPAEARMAEEKAAAIQHVLERPMCASAVARARRWLQRSAHLPDPLLHESMRRVRLGRMRRPELYREFLAWLAEHRDRWALGPLDPEGAATLLFYDSEAWHHRLFELFGLWRLAEALARRAGRTPEQIQHYPLYHRDRGPIFRFELPPAASRAPSEPVQVEVFYQRARDVLWTPACPPRVRLRAGSTTPVQEEEPHEVFEEVEVSGDGPPSRYLIGVPDVVIRCSYGGRSVHFIVDFKNRRRIGEERSKMLDYFFRFSPMVTYPAGCLVFRTATPKQGEVWELNPGLLGVFYTGPVADPDVSEAPWEGIVQLLREACQNHLGVPF